MKDLSALAKTVIVLLGLAAMLGCQALNASRPTTSQDLALAAPNLDFGTVVVGNSEGLTNTIVNTTSAPITLESVVVDKPEFTVTGLKLPVTLGPGHGVNLNVAYRPRARGTASATVALEFTVAGEMLAPTVGVLGQGVNFNVAFTPRMHRTASEAIVLASNQQVTSDGFHLSGGAVSPGQLTASPSSISFGNVPVGQSQSQPATLSNSGGSNLTVNQITVSGTGFSISGLSLPATLVPGQSVPMIVTFTPVASGSTSGTVSLLGSISMQSGGHKGKGHASFATLDSVSTSLNLPVSGSGMATGQLLAAPSSLSLGSVQVGASQSASATLTNTSSSTVTISQATVTGAGFSINGLSLPLTLAAGQSASFSVTFAPQSAGSVSGNINVASDAANPSLNLALSATALTTGALAASPSSLSFGSVQVGSNQTLQATLTNSGGSGVTVSQANVSGAGFSVNGLTLPVTLASGQGATFNVAFAPQTGGSAGGTISIVSNASNPTLTLAISGSGATPGKLAVASPSVSFGNVQVGSTTTQSETLTNSGGATVNVTQANVAGNGFSITGLKLPMTLSPGQSFTFGVAFAPTSAGSVSGGISVVSDASNPNVTVSLSGSGAVPGQLTISPGALSFGSVVVGTSKNLNASLSASGSSITVSSATFGTSEFTLSGISLPLTLAAGQSASFSVTFTPQASGTASDSASFTSNASNSPAVEALSGSGTPPPQHSVALSWSASTSSVVGYNVYRGSTTGGPYTTKINTALNASTNYTDNSVQAGQTYYYVTTAVDGSGAESGYSNQVQALIPTP